MYSVQLQDVFQVLWYTNIDAIIDGIIKKKEAK